MEYRWVEQDEYDKIVGQFKLQTLETLGCFDMYGMGDFIPGAANEIVDNFVIGLQKIRGKDKPYSKIKRIPRRDR